MNSQTYLRRQRHILLDMHIPDWDERVLSGFDPTSFIGLCASSGADSVMVYCSSIADQCLWPTKVGRMHAGLAGRDAVGEVVAGLRERGLAVCVYCSAVFNHWAYTEHPEWRFVASADDGAFGPESRFGLCCPNNAEYLEFVLRQTEELASGYPFDGFFFDMLFWPGVSVCHSCRDRYGSQEGADLPEAVDWYSPEWCRFQAAQERWLADTFRRLRDRVNASLDVPVFHNGAVIGMDWMLGIGHELVALNDVIGGDFLDRSLFPTFARLSPTVMQYMHPFSGFTGGLSQPVSTEEQRTHALTATTFGAQFMMAIDAVEPDGAVNPAAYERLAEVFDAIRPYEAYLGGTPVADIAVYRSLDSAVSFSENATRLDQASFSMDRFERPGAHVHAVQGGVAALEAAHLPVGVVTRADLGRLDGFPVIVLPNVLRMDTEEVAAFRRCVKRGGRLYASGYTSLVTVDGICHDDFLLADVFGCHLVGAETAALTYVKPANPEAEAWIAPVRYAPQGEPRFMYTGSAPEVTALRVSAEDGTRVLATTTLPYGQGRGSRDNQQWASSFVTPPWEDTTHPAVGRHRFGRGEVVYATADLEATGGHASASAQAMFVGLVGSLLPRRPTFEADAHPNVVVTAFDEPDQSRLRLCVLNRADDFPALPVPHVTLRVSPVDGVQFSGVHRLPDGEPIPSSVADDGALHAELDGLELFEMLVVGYEQSSGGDR